MKSIFAKEFSRIDLGYRGENLARQVVFDLSEWRSTYGNGTAMLIAQLPGETAPYPCVCLREDNKLLWQLSAADTSVAGQGKCELSYYVGEQLVKSAVFSTYIAESLAPIGEAPEPTESWVEDILAAGADALSAKEAIENMTVSAETLSSDASAAVSKTEQDGKVHLAFSLPRGERGERGEKGKDGANGAPGYTPVRGVDYFTDDDIAYFDDHLSERLGAIDMPLDAIITLQNSLIGGESV